MIKSKTTLIKEGETSVFVPLVKKSNKGPGAQEHIVFYNPAMESSRDLSVVITQWFIDKQKKDVEILDGLAATGIRGVRLAKEVNGNAHVSINDHDEDAYRLIKRNISFNHLDNTSASKMDLNLLLSSNKYDMIDVDPFGSPVYFIDSAIRSIRHRGVLSCTATDTATLCGVYPDVCLRRYNAHPYRSPIMQEVGLRILLGLLAREAAKHDKGIEPLLCYSTDYYFRLYVQVNRGVTYADETIKKLSVIKSDDIKRYTHSEEVKVNSIGPLYTGNIVKKPVISELRGILSNKELNTKKELFRLLDVLEEEADAPLFYYTIESISSHLKVNPPRRDKLFQYLRDNGYMVTRTHITPTGFKTNASLETVEEAFINLSRVKKN